MFLLANICVTHIYSWHVIGPYKPLALVLMYNWLGITSFKWHPSACMERPKSPTVPGSIAASFMLKTRRRSRFTIENVKMFWFEFIHLVKKRQRTSASAQQWSQRCLRSMLISYSKRWPIIGASNLLLPKYWAVQRKIKTFSFIGTVCGGTPAIDSGAGHGGRQISPR